MVQPSHKPVKLARERDRWRLTFKHGQESPSRMHKHVILASGFDNEKSCGDAKPDPVRKDL